jgi:hypothetical protein
MITDASDPFVAMALKVNMIVLFVKLGLNDEHEKMFSL